MEATTLNTIGAVHRSQAELDQALAYYEQALAIVSAATAMRARYLGEAHALF